MKKIKKFLLGNIKTVVAFFLGIIISGTSVYAATILFNSNQVGYDNTTSGSSSTDVQGAIDELYAKVNTWIDPSTYPLKMNSTKTVWATPVGLCIKRDGVNHCFATNNWTYEKEHLQQVFSTNVCQGNSNYQMCDGCQIRCDFFSDGGVQCGDSTQNSNVGCYVSPDGSVSCN